MLALSHAPAELLSGEREGPRWKEVPSPGKGEEVSNKLHQALGHWLKNILWLHPAHTSEAKMHREDEEQGRNGAATISQVGERPCSQQPLHMTHTGFCH